MGGMQCKLWMVYGVLFLNFPPFPPDCLFSKNRILPSELFLKKCFRFPSDILHKH